MAAGGIRAPFDWDAARFTEWRYEPAVVVTIWSRLL